MATCKWLVSLPTGYVDNSEWKASGKRGESEIRIEPPHNKAWYDSDFAPLGVDVDFLDIGSIEWRRLGDDGQIKSLQIGRPTDGGDRRPQNDARLGDLW